MININTATLATTIAIIVAACLMLGIVVMREAFRRGVTHAHSEMANVRTDYAKALEHQESEHLDELVELRAAMRRETHNTKLEISGRQMQIELLTQDLQELRARTLTLVEIQLLSDLAGKLRLASPALHAQQQFAEARKTKELASRLDILIKRLLPAGEAEEHAA